MKKNYRFLPEFINSNLEAIEEQYIIVSKALRIKKYDIQNDSYAHLGIHFDESGLNYENIFTPIDEQGKHSKRNVLGYEIVRRDLPMIPYTISFDVPNWGDSSKGCHTVNIDRYKYRRDLIPPRSVSFIIECQDTSPELDEYLIVFRLDEILDKLASDFTVRLFDLINIMQENLFTCGINKASTSFEEYISTLLVNWEILPHGDVETVLSNITRSFSNNVSPNILANLRERVIFFNTRNPKNYIIGTSGLVRYYGVKLSDNLVIFENLQYGNAMYIMYDNWEYLSKKSRVELLTGMYGDNFDRIIHKNGWNVKVAEIINKKLNNKQYI